MKKKILIIILTVIFVLVLIAINLFLNNHNGIKKEEKTQDKIIEVTSQTFEEEVLKSDKMVLIDFYATWCGPCKMLEPIMEQVATENENVKFVRIDIDKAEDIATQYKIVSIPTLVLIQNGEEKDRRIGLADKTTILEFIQGKQ